MLISPGICHHACSWRTSPSTRATSPLCKFMMSSNSRPLPGLYDSILKSQPILPQVVPAQTVKHCTKTHEELHERTLEALWRASDPTKVMRLIDSLQRLGIAYHFEEDHKVLLERLSDWKSGDDLYATALRFRLLRHNGCPVSSDVFDMFLNEKGKFMESLTGDTNGMLSLYEASFLGTNGEDTLTQAMEFTTTRLKEVTPHLTPEFGRHIGQALELPIHLRMARLEARNYTDQYVKESTWSSDVLELAKLDFNMVQSLHQTELAELVRWWKELGLCDKLTFARDRPLECFLWTVGIFPEPHQSTCRIELAKNVAILLVIDDIFDSYGTLSELTLFASAIRRWDLGAMEELPQYMKICYMALYNTTNEIGYRVLKEHGRCIVSHLKRTWIEMIEAFLVEATWFCGAYVPTLDEYLENGVKTAGTYMALEHTFFLMGHQLTEGTTGKLEGYPKLFSCSGRILRLWDDLGTATEEQQRGDVASSIECIMKEQKLSSEAEARTHIRQLIQNQWKELNAELMAANTLPLSTIKACFNLSRTAQAIYEHGHDNRAPRIQDHAESLFSKPIAL